MARKPKLKPDLPARGQAFLMPLADGRFGVCRVLRVGEEVEENAGRVLAASSPWIGSQAPALDEPRLRELLLLTHHSWDGSPNAIWLNDPVPPTFQSLGAIEPSQEESSMERHPFGGWEWLAVQVLEQWRWDNDREAVLRQDEAEKRAQVLAIEQDALRRRQELAALTLPELLKKRRFSSWSGCVPPKPLRATRQIFRSTVQDLLDLGPEPRTRDALRILRACIRDLNALDEEHGFIETVEREDLGEAFDEIAHAAGFGQDGLADRWRDW